MGIWRRTFGIGEVVDQLSSAPTFEGDEITPDPEIGGAAIPPEIYGLSSWSTSIGPVGRVDRRAAVQCGAVSRSRDLVPGVLGTLPIDLFGPGHVAIDSPLFKQPERDKPRSVTLTETYEDMFFEGVAWWRILERDYRGFPTKVRRLDARTVNVRDDQKVYVAKDGQMQGAAQEWVPDSDLIRFDSPNDGLLIKGARAIRTALQLEIAASNMSDGTPPIDYFVPSDDADPIEDDDEIIDILNAWQQNRRQRKTAYVPAALKYMTAGWNPDQLKLKDQRDQAVLEVARHAGVDPEDLGVSTTSRTYATEFGRRKSFTDFTLGGFLTAMQDRLSMNDVSPNGNYARVNLSAFLRSDDKTRYETWEIGKRIGAITGPEIRQEEERPPLDEEPTPAPPVAPPAPHLVPVPPLAAAAELGPTFTEPAEIVMDAASAQGFEVDRERRIIRGLIVPYGVPARSNGQWFQFSQGTLTYADVTRVKLWVQHNPDTACGYAFELNDRPDGMWGAFQVARTPEGDHALQMAEDKVWDGFSIGLGVGGKFVRRGIVNHAISAPLMETSLTPAPSFDDARVHSVAASAANPSKGITTMPCATCGHVHAEGVVECQTTFTAPPADAAPTFDLTPITEAIAAGFSSLANPQEGPEHVNAGGQTRAQVTEALPYRFDGVRGEHSFSADLRDSASGNAEAQQRLDTFLEEAFAVSTGNVATLNPTQNRPELYVPSLEFTRPLFSAVSKGTITDITAFTVPKFASSSGLVGAHTEGTEPTPGAFAATNQTVQPGALSGKIEIRREVWDQGGSPQADTIIWREMVNGYYEAVETKIAARLKTTPTAELNLASAVDAPLVNALTAYFAGLQFVRGGNRFTAFASDGKLFPALVAAADTTGRKLLPVLAPQNAQGTTNGAFSEVQLGNQAIKAAWALGAGNDALSFSFVPSSVWCWVSAPKRFTFEYQVKSIDMAIWGYEADAILRDSDVKPIDYTTADA